MSDVPPRSMSPGSKIGIACACVVVVLIAGFLYVVSNLYVADDTSDHRSTVERFRQATSSYAPGQMLYWLGRGHGAWSLSYPDPESQDDAVSLDYDVRDVGMLRVLTYYGLRPSPPAEGSGIYGDVIARVRTATNQDVELRLRVFTRNPAPSPALIEALKRAVRPITDAEIQQYSTRD
jgi:hypothetical protein